MATFVLPQTGVFALGTPIQTFYEFDLAEPRPDAATLLNVVRSLIVGVKTGQGSNVVVGVRPSLLATILPAQCPSGVHDFDADVVGAVQQYCSHRGLLKL